MTVKDKSFNFAKSYQELEKLVAFFEKEDLDLEEGIKKFEQGLVLVKEIKAYLATMENKVKILRKTAE